MSAHRVVEIRCDGPAAGVDCPDSAAWTDSGRAIDLRARMRRDGWSTSRDGGTDRCPTCSSVNPRTGVPR